MLEKLSKEEYSKLMKLPVYISLLAANSDGQLDEEEKKTAIKFTHVKTFSSPKALRKFYEDVEKEFDQTISELDKALPKGREQRESAIKAELSKVERIFRKLGKDYADLIFQSLRSYIKHVSKAHSNLLESFFIPLHIKGLTD